jgi:hypothetical protein
MDPQPKEDFLALIRILRLIISEPEVGALALPDESDSDE